MRKGGILDCDPPRKPDSEDLLSQNSIGMWIVRVHRRLSCMVHLFTFWKCTLKPCMGQRVNRRSRNKTTSQCPDPVRDQDARSSNHEPNQEADRDPKQLSECDSRLCEQAHNIIQMSQIHWWAPPPPPEGFWICYCPICSVYGWHLCVRSVCNIIRAVFKSLHPIYHLAWSQFTNPKDMAKDIILSWSHSIVLVNLNEFSAIFSLQTSENNLKPP